MIYVLDTDILSLLGHADSQEAPRIRRRIAELPPDAEVVTTVVNYEEQMRGWMAALSRAQSAAFEVQIYGRLLEHLQTYRRLKVLTFDATAAAIVKRLQDQRIRVGVMDSKIAAIVVAQGAVLVTRNVVDFRKIPKLHIEDWTLEHDQRA